MVSTNRDDVIDASNTIDTNVYALNANDVIHCSQGSCKAYGGDRNDFIAAGASGGVPHWLLTLNCMVGQVMIF